MSYYRIFFTNGSVIDEHKSHRVDEETFITDQLALADKISKIIRQSDGVVVYTDKS